jgi:hypothetical protein
MTYQRPDQCIKLLPFGTLHVLSQTTSQYTVQMDQTRTREVQLLFHADRFPAIQ